MNSIQESYFLELTAPFLGLDPRTQSLMLSLISESSTFIRFNHARVRQAGTVEDTTLSLQYLERNTETDPHFREASASIPLTGEMGADRLAIRSALDHLKVLTRAGAPKPWATWPTRGEQSSTIPLTPSCLPSADRWAEILLPQVKDLDFTGILTSGRMVRATRNSLSQFHWFETESASLDYSLISETGRAVKSEFLLKLPFSEEEFVKEFQKRIQHERTLLDILKRPSVSLKSGEYRCYLGPAAVQDLIQMFSWGCVSEDAIRQGVSPLKSFRNECGKNPSGTNAFSSLFHLHEDFKQNGVPRFNERGELAPERLELITAGQLKATWISNETAQEWALTANGANSDESLRSPVVLGGTLPEKEALARLGTGVYLPNLHYLNWSDQPAGRITGMTRHACVWVENGIPVAPIENMRWDDTLWRIFGSELEDLTQELTSIPDTGSYEHRALGATTVPGALLRSFRFTL